jgi:4-aminobutyrate aminotransferase/diaminobutyrate-2-oxoglutarate transaminase
VLNLGHVNPVVTAAVKSQLDRIWHSLEIPTGTRIAFLEKMHSILPGELRGHAKILFTVTGGDACEAAVSPAHYVSGRKMVVAFEGAYHGVHQGIVGATSAKHYLATSGAVRYDVFHLPFPYSYRFPFPVERKGDEANVVLRYLEHCLTDPYSGLVT